MEEIVKQAKENLKGVVSEQQIGYVGFLKKEIKKILKERGIQASLIDDNVSID